MIREALLESDRFLSLADNTARMCFVSVLLTADDRGNLEASPGQLVRMWRDFGVDSNVKASLIAQSLADQDLIRMYEAEGKQYAHVPRFGQRLRHLTHACPPSPWCDRQEKQQGDMKTVGRTADERLTNDSRTSVEEKRSEEKRSEEVLTLAIAKVVKAPALPCPHEAIVTAYHEILPMGRQVVDWNGARAQHLKARWREKVQRQNIDWWRRFFGYVSQSKFLTGQAPTKPGSKPFEVSLGWIVKPENFAKIVEGAYNG